VVFQTDAALPALGSHPSTRRLLALHRAIDRLQLSPDAHPNAWTGAVPSALLSASALQATALRPDALARLVLDPADYFWRDILGARRARSLRRLPFNMSRSGIDRQVLELCMAAASDPAASFSSLWEARLQEAATRLGVHDVATIDAWRKLGQRSQRRFIDAHHSAISANAPLIEGARVVSEVPLMVSSEPAPLHSGALVLPTSGALGVMRPTNLSAFSVLTQGFAARAAGEPVQRIRMVSINGTQREHPLSKSEAEYQDLVKQAWRRVQVGWWPISNSSDPLALSAERRAAKAMTPQLAAAIISNMEARR
jgi:hypothetical protein